VLDWCFLLGFHMQASNMYLASLCISSCDSLGRGSEAKIDIINETRVNTKR
jgi:hypothetical protein